MILNVFHPVGMAPQGSSSGLQVPVKVEGHKDIYPCSPFKSQPDIPESNSCVITAGGKCSAV